MSHHYDYCQGDRVRIVQASLAAPHGTEATVVKVYRDTNDTITALDVLIAPDPAHTHGTKVFPQEIELLSSSTHRE